MLKKTIKFLLVFILVLGFAGCGSKANKDEKVKVYVFEAGGCPYCEAQMDYLKSLEGYNKTFEVIEEELYVDHIEWAQGKDYELGVKVANAFNEAGFEEASYQGTPFVVISDIYASASYNPSLEETIKIAIEEGDNDVVGCFEKSDECDIRENLSDTDKKVRDIRNNNLINYIIIYALIGGIIVYLFLNRNKKETKVLAKEVKVFKEIKEEKPKKVVKKTQTQKKKK